MPAIGGQPERRKVRKGTQSCWECKRRKIKCTFAAPQHITCDGCRRRGTPCVGQEFPPCNPEHIGDRLGRVEALVEQLVQSAGARINPLLSSMSNDLAHHNGGVSVGGTTASNSAVFASNVETIDGDQGHISRTKPLPELPLLPTTVASVLSTHLARQNEEICSALRAAWPSEHDLNIILSVPVDITGCFHGLICTSHFESQQVPSPREMLQLPAPGSHPVLVAQKLLLLGSFLQSIPPTGIQNLDDLSISHHDIMSRVVNSVHGLVNCDDELVSSIEGIECIAMESMHHNDAGNLRRSWVTMRRAMLIAQMMGLHRGKHPPSVKTLECQTCTSPDHIWLRLVQSDRYLSLMLGLPQGAPEVSFFTTSKTMESCTPTERLQRIDCAAAGLIIQRNEADINDLVATQEIDNLLHQASIAVAPQWWLIPNLAPSGINQMDVFHETIRLMSQFTHYHLVARLHLPYLLRSIAGDNYEYSKATAIHASREVLARFVSFRCSNPFGSYCRGIDFLAFIAGTSICLAHIHAHDQARVFSGNSNGRFFFNTLVHQRPSDRGMMERALQSLELMASTSQDAIASTIATVFRQLLLIEADAADGSSYSTSSSIVDEAGLGCDGGLSDSGNVLHIHLPFLGTIKIQRSGVSRSTQSGIPTISEPQISPANLAAQPAGRRGEFGRQSQDMPESPTTHGINDQLGYMERQAQHGEFHSPLPSRNSLSVIKVHNIIPDVRDDSPHIACPFISGQEVAAEDWAMQGVDTALFDSLIRGSDLEDAGLSYGT